MVAMVVLMENSDGNGVVISSSNGSNDDGSS